MSEVFEICERGISYLKPNVFDDELDDDEPIILQSKDMMFETPLNDELFVAYLVDDKDTGLFKYIQNRHLEEEDISSEEMKEIGLNNLKDRAKNSLRMQEFGSGIYSLFLDGNFEASLILIDALWENTLKKFVKNNYVVAIPARDVLVFCDSESKEAIAKLRTMCTNVAESGDHLLTNTLYYRKNCRWEKYI